MALIKQQEQSSGVTGEYWRILETNISYQSQLARVVLGLYKDKQARNDGKETLHIESFDWSGEDFPFTIDELTRCNPVQLSYVKIKESKLDEEGNETNWFADAIDD